MNPKFILFSIYKFKMKFFEFVSQDISYEYLEHIYDDNKILIIGFIIKTDKGEILNIYY